MVRLRGSAAYRQAAAEFKRKAEQEMNVSKREYYFELHRHWLRLAITYEENEAA